MNIFYVSLEIKMIGKRLQLARIKNTFVYGTVRSKINKPILLTKKCDLFLDKVVSADFVCIEWSNHFKIRDMKKI